jgi:hypothetical protein
MRVYIAELWHTPQDVDDIVIPQADEMGLPSETFLYVPIPRWTPIDQLDNAIYRIPSNIRRSTSYVVLRVHQTEVEGINSSKTLAARLAIDWRACQFLFCTPQVILTK